MLILVILLVVTNLVTLAVLAYLYLVPRIGPGPDATTAAALDRSPRPPAVPGGTRRVISIEILNPIELAGTRGRIAGIAGSLAPGLTRRIVYDQTLKILKQQLVDQQVVADVRLHVLRPVERLARPAASAARDRPPRPEPERTAPPLPGAPSADLPSRPPDDVLVVSESIQSEPSVATTPEAGERHHRSRRHRGRRQDDRAAHDRPVAYSDDVEKVDLDKIDDGG